ncbi:hypothetical protein BGX26_012169, partial [Mortierella sp. AD094]
SHQNDNVPLEGLRQLLEDARNQTGVAGMSVAVLYKGKLIFAEGFGKRNEHDPFTPETVSMIGSVTKGFTAAAVGQLVAEGKVDWDITPVNKYLPEFELQDPGFTSQLTLEDLLSHRTGFPNIDLAWYFNTEPRKDLIKRLKYVKTGTKLTPNTQYNNMIFAVAGIAAANAAGVEYEDLIRDKIFKPLGLNNTGLSMKEMSKHSNYALPYIADSFEDAKNGIFKILPQNNEADAGAPAGNIYSNVLDLVRYGQVIMHYGKQDGKHILNKDSIIRILSGQSIAYKGRRLPDFAPIMTYGMGWILDSYKGNIMYYHNGAIDGYTSNIRLFPDSDLVIAHVANTHQASLPDFSMYYVVEQILGLPRTQDWMQKCLQKTVAEYDRVAAARKGDFPAKIKNKPASHPLSEFAGDYTDPVYGDLSIILKKDSKGEEGLHFKLRVYEGILTHYHYDSFNTTFGYSAVYVTELVTFETGQDGKVSGVRVMLDPPNRVTFQKK